MTTIGLKWDGVPQLLNDYKQVGQALDARSKPVKKVLMGPAKAMVNNARSMAPKRTGNLAASIFATEGPDEKPGVLMLVNQTKAPYARFVEFGSSRTPAQPYFRPALAQMTGSYLNDIQPGVKQIVEETAPKYAYHPPS